MVWTLLWWMSGVVSEPMLSMPEPREDYGVYVTQATGYQSVPGTITVTRVYCLHNIQSLYHGVNLSQKIVTIELKLK